MSLNHWDLDQGAAGLKKGFFVVKTEFEWRSLWPQTEADKIPALAAGFDLKKEMLLVSTPGEPDILSVELHEAIDTDQGKITST